MQLFMSLPYATEPIGEYATKCVTHGHCDARLTVTFPTTPPWLVLISHPIEGRKLSWPQWLVTYQDGIPTNGHPSDHLITNRD